MEKKNKIILIILVILTTVIISFCIYSIMNKDIKNSDADKFRNEYMSLNDVMIDNTEKTYLNIAISETNTVEYVDINKLVAILKKGTGIIFIGDPKNVESRNIAPILTNIAIEKEQKIYYIDITNIAPKFKLKNGVIEKTKNGSKDYYSLTNILDKHLKNYTMIDKNKNEIEFEEKIIITPTVIAVNKGIITDYHENLVDGFNKEKELMSDAQEKEITKILKSLIDSLNNSSCSNESKC